MTIYRQYTILNISVIHWSNVLSSHVYTPNTVTISIIYLILNAAVNVTSDRIIRAQTSAKVTPQTFPPCMIIPKTKVKDSHKPTLPFHQVSDPTEIVIILANLPYDSVQISSSETHFNSYKYVRLHWRVWMSTTCVKLNLIISVESSTMTPFLKQ